MSSIYIYIQYFAPGLLADRKSPCAPPGFAGNSPALDSSHPYPFCSTEDGSVQHAATDADSVLDVLQLRLQKLRASTGEDVLTANCMYELARRLHGRARYGEAEKLYRECLRISLDLSLPQGATVIALVLRRVFFRSPHEGN